MIPYRSRGSLESVSGTIGEIVRILHLLKRSGGLYLTQRKHKLARGLLFDRESPQQRADFVCNPIGRFVV